MVVVVVCFVLVKAKYSNSYDHSYELVNPPISCDVCSFDYNELYMFSLTADQSSWLKSSSIWHDLPL